MPNMATKQRAYRNVEILSGGQWKAPKSTAIWKNRMEWARIAVANKSNLARPTAIGRSCRSSRSLRRYLALAGEIRITPLIWVWAWGRHEICDRFEPHPAAYLPGAWKIRRKSTANSIPRADPTYGEFNCSGCGAGNRRK